MPTNINLKSMVWYPKDDFDAAGYEVPETWDDLIALSDQIVADGSTPWCVGFESGGATGWPATDWMEDIMLRTAGADVYDQWVTHEIPFDDPAVKSAAETLRRDHVHRRTTCSAAPPRPPDIAFGDAPAPMFEDPPECWLHRQASFINASFFPEDAEAGVDYDWFPLPPIDQEGILSPVSSPSSARTATGPRSSTSSSGSSPRTCSARWAACTASSRISPNVNVGPDCYANDILADASEVLTDGARGGHRALRRLRPHAGRGRAAAASGRAWSSTCKGGPDSLDGVLADIEASWP